MSSTTDFITELIRAANEVGRLTSTERTRLMIRGARTIRAMRLQTGIRPGAGPDPLNNVEIAALKSANGSDEEATKVFLELADMIRTMKIALDRKDGDGDGRTWPLNPTIGITCARMPTAPGVSTIFSPGSRPK